MKRENIVLGQGTKYPLKGILTLPEAGGKFPAVVFVHGSGSSNMDEQVGKLTPFKDLAEGLARYGIASVRYDKRSFTHGLKMMKESCITVREETIEDAILAVKLLREDQRIDPNKVFIVGHSMGAMLAPRIDAEGGNFAGLVLMAGTLRKMEDILLYQTREMQASSGKLLAWILEKQIKKLEASFAGLYEMSDEEAKTKNMGGGTTLYYFKEMGIHPAERYLETITKPVLIMQGGKDFQVKADLDFAGYQKLLGERENVSFRLYESLNHAFVPGICNDITKAKKEYNVERHIGENVIGDLANWILAI